jgi:hypothetical protein
VGAIKSVVRAAQRWDNHKVNEKTLALNRQWCQTTSIHPRQTLHDNPFAPRQTIGNHGPRAHIHTKSARVDESSPGKINECQESNNDSVIEGVVCPVLK